jgi:hypothetical protein
VFSDAIEVVYWFGRSQSLGKAGYTYAISGEVRNISPHTIAFVRLQFRIYDRSLALLQNRTATVIGARTRRVRSTGENITVLLPGDVGIFETWTGYHPSVVAAEQLVGTSAEIVDVEPPIATVSATPGTIEGFTYSGSITNHGPAFVSVAEVSAGAYGGDTLADVSATTVYTPPAPTCGGQTWTSLRPGQEAPFRIEFLGVSMESVAHVVPFWRELGTLEPTALDVPASGGASTLALTVETPGWCAVSTVPWITVTNGATGSASAGEVAFTVQPNPGGARSGSISVSGMVFIVTQAGGYACPNSVSPSPIIMGANAASQTVTIETESVCSWTVSSSASWLSIAGGAGNGTGTFTVHANANPERAPRSATIVAGNTAVSIRQYAASHPLDMNGDGRMDLLWQHEMDGSLAAWLMQGQTLREGLLLTPPNVSDLDWKVSGGGDVDGDGRPDLIWHHQGDGRLAAWLMNGSRQIEGRLLSPEAVPDTGWQVRAVTDFDNDGHPDLIWQHDDGREAVWFMNGLSAISGNLLAPPSVTDTAWRIAGSGDFDADGQQDLVWQHLDGRIAVWLMSGTSLRDGYVLSSIAPQPGLKLRAVGDLNGDGSPDLISQNELDGTIVAWLMMGSLRLESLSLGQVSDPGWRIVGPR